MILLLLVAFQGLFVESHSYAECIADLKQWARALVYPIGTTDDRYSRMTRYSGRRINDLGFYFECNHISGARHVIFEAQESPAILIGLCLPDTCSANSLWRVIHRDFNWEFSQLFNNELLRFPESRFNNTSQRRLGFSIQKIVFPIDHIKNFKDFDAAAILILISIMLLILASISAAVYEVSLSLAQRKSLVLNSEEILYQDPEAIVQKSFMGELKPTEIEINKTQKVILAFSLISNVKKLFKTQKAKFKDPLDFLNAIKVLSIMWIVFGNTEYFRFQDSVLLNLDSVHLYTTHTYFALIYSSLFGVDTIFWVSGFLQSHMLTYFLCTSPKINILLLYLSRILRLLPLYIFVLLSSWSLTKYAGNGPKWYNADDLMHRDCYDYFWTYLLFINNFVIPDSTYKCLVGAWYVPNDIQFFIITIPIIYLYCKYNRAYGWIMLLTLITLTAVANGVIAYDQHFTVNVLTLNYSLYVKDMLYKPYCRIGPYAIGVLTGFVYFNKKYSNGVTHFDIISGKIADSIKKQDITRWTIYFLGFFLLNLMIWVQYSAFQGKSAWSRSQNAAFFAFSRLTWGLSLSLIFLPMILGQASVLRPFLQSNWWIPASRLSYAVFLIHMIIGEIFFFSQPITYYYSQTNLIMDSLFILSLSFILAIPLVVLIELPFSNLQKLFLKLK